jgi:hypothetical protein
MTMLRMVKLFIDMTFQTLLICKYRRDARKLNPCCLINVYLKSLDTAIMFILLNIPLYSHFVYMYYVQVALTAR